RMVIVVADRHVAEVGVAEQALVRTLSISRRETHDDRHRHALSQTAADGVVAGVSAEHLVTRVIARQNLMLAADDRDEVASRRTDEIEARADRFARKAPVILFASQTLFLDAI